MNAHENQLIELTIATDVGEFIVRYSRNGLAKLDFPQVGSACQVDLTFRRSASANRIVRWHRLAEAALRKILAGSEPESFPPLDLSCGTGFQRAVWKALREVPFGKTKSYGEIAKTIGKPRAVRAVGGACAANPIPVLVPCHRVLAANERLGGFSSGLNWKRKLLAREGVRL